MAWLGALTDRHTDSSMYPLSGIVGTSRMSFHDRLLGSLHVMAIYCYCRAGGARIKSVCCLPTLLILPAQVPKNKRVQQKYSNKLVFFWPDVHKRAHHK